MRALLTSLTLISAISLSSAAFAANTATGTVRAFDAKTLTLKDGTSYMLPASFKDPGIKVGEKVKVAYDMIGKKHQATAVTPAQ
ncbi:DUF1344 domain-containing protein [Pararhizobium sp. O133]|uniref:DUF1344 domain-containing protein n=1 Tax=Pararhizobium sp. O133 TaxID=3449278 RepID=UPI003F682692